MVCAAVTPWKRTQESFLTWLLSLWGLLSLSSGKRIFGRCYLEKAFPSITSISGSPLPWLPLCVCFSLTPRNTNPVASHAYLHIQTEAILALELWLITHTKWDKQWIWSKNGRKNRVRESYNIYDISCGFNNCWRDYVRWRGGLDDGKWPHKFLRELLELQSAYSYTSKKKKKVMWFFTWIRLFPFDRKQFAHLEMKAGPWLLRTREASIQREVEAHFTSQPPRPPQRPC